MTGGRRGVGVGVIAVIIALLAVVVLARPHQDPYLRDPLDPRGTGREGLAASVALLRHFGSAVVLGGLPGRSDDVVFQPAARLNGDPQARLSAWVRAGGTLVVTDTSSDLAAHTTGADNNPVSVSAEASPCNLDALSGVAELGVGIPRNLTLRPGESYCFLDDRGDPPRGRAAGVVVARLGAGIVVTVSAIDPFLNENLGRGDDAQLLVGLLGPAEGRRIRVLDPNRFLSDRQVGDGTILGAIGDRGRQALLEVTIAFLLWGLVRGRRLGQPVPETLPVSVPGSELVLAVGEMLARRDDVAGVTDRLRRRSRRELGIALGLGADPAPDAVIASLVDHVSIDAAQLRRTLVDPVPDVTALLDVAHQLDRLREEIHDIS